MTSIAQPDLTWVGMDVHKDTISVGILGPGREVPVVDKIFHDEPSVRRLFSHFDDPATVRACYEAGPTGYPLARLLESMGIVCEVVAPSLIPVTAGRRVKTDRRDACRLARLYRAGELTFVRIPGDDEEAARELCRARARLVADRDRARRRLGALLLRHNRIYRAGKPWTQKHGQWLNAQTFDQPALTATFAHYRAEVIARTVAVEVLEADLRPWYDRDPFADPVRRLSCYRGIAELGALSLTLEVSDWRRFPSAGKFMSFVGLVPSEYSSGGNVHRGRLTKAGNETVRTQLVESAWSYHHRPGVSVDMRRRQQGATPTTIARAWNAQLRLCRRWQALAARHKQPTIIAAAIARELSGFVWAEMTATDPA